MPRYYVDLTEVSPTLLGLMGYVLVAENKKLELYLHKGEFSVVRKFPPRFMYVDDVNDATALVSLRSSKCAGKTPCNFAPRVT
jgi:hypothetical protein